MTRFEVWLNGELMVVVNSFAEVAEAILGLTLTGDITKDSEGHAEFKSIEILKIKLEH